MSELVCAKCGTIEADLVHRPESAMVRPRSQYHAFEPTQPTPERCPHGLTPEPGTVCVRCHNDAALSPKPEGDRAKMCRDGFHDLEFAEPRPHGALLECMYCDYQKDSRRTPKPEGDGREVYQRAAKECTREELEQFYVETLADREGGVDAEMSDLLRLMLDLVHTQARSEEQHGRPRRSVSWLPTRAHPAWDRLRALADALPLLSRPRPEDPDAAV